MSKGLFMTSRGRLYTKKGEYFFAVTAACASIKIIGFDFRVRYFKLLCQEFKRCFCDFRQGMNELAIMLITQLSQARTKNKYLK